MERSSNKSDPMLFLPPAFLNLNLHPTSCELVRKKTADSKKISYSITITVEQTLMETNVAINTPGCYQNVINEQEKEVINRTKKDEDKIKKLYCDGACSRKHFSNCLVTFVDCKHQLCIDCMELVRNVDGSLTCSSYACVRKTMFSHLSNDEAAKSYNLVIRTKFIETRAEKRKSNILSDTESYIYCYRQPSMVKLVDVYSGSSKSPVSMSSAAEKSPFTVLFNTQLDGNDVIRLFMSFRAQSDKTPLQVLEHEKARLNILLLTKESNCFKRMMLSHDTTGSNSLIKALTDCLGRWANLIEQENSSVYFCDGMSSASVRLIKTDELREALLCKYKGISGNLHYVIDSAACTRF
ncbi:unnamed protein product [Auanema sp. JU1783]|nr:unnamed protein product [Auanema sp. JU1783]